MIGVTNDEKVFHGSMEKTTVRKRGDTIEQKKTEEKKRLIISFFFWRVFRSIRKY